MNASRYETLTGATGSDFPEYDAPPPAPMPLVARWLDRALQCGVREPRALALATADTHGRPSNRMVAITALTDRGLEFATHSCSQKGRDLAVRGWASGLFYWRETGQQIVVCGPAPRLGDVECDALWAGRPVPLHAMSSASRQSEVLDDPAGLAVEASRLEALGVPLPRPERFVAYRLEPAAVEFWSASPDRLHRRLRYDRHGDTWRTSRLQP